MIETKITKGVSTNKLGYPKLMVNKTNDTIIMALSGKVVDLEGPQIYGIVLNSKNGLDIVGRIGYFYLDLLMDFEGELTIKNK